MPAAQKQTSELQIQSFRAQAQSLTQKLVLPHTQERLWPYLANTDMLNALSSLPEIHILPDSQNGIVTVESKDLGLLIRYLELPYEWTRPQGLKVERIFLKGPVTYLRFELQLTASAAAQTEVIISLAIVPKLPWILIKQRLQQILDKLLRGIEKISARLSRLGPDVLAAETFGQDPALQNGKISLLCQDWQTLTQNPQIARKLAEHVCCAPERYVGRMRPFELARRYGFDKLETLRFFLRATREGFLNLSWDLLCPSCQGAKGQAESLSKLDPTVHCDACGIDYTGRFDENFELTFKPVHTLRPIRDVAYCAGSPANTGHICQQGNLWPNQTQLWQQQLAMGTYRFRASHLSGTLPFSIAADGLAAWSLELKDPLTEPEQALVLRPDCQLSVTNATGHFLTLKIEDLAWREERVSAGLISTMQDFRDMFSSEVLRPGVNLAVSNLTIMFTDLKDSTLMYDIQGDAHAFSLVQDHFDILQELIREAGGAVVKTIGDAVMAVFQDPAQALDCGLKIQREFRQWNEEWFRDDASRRAIIKLGLHRGPCIALNLNDRLDYFGSTINKAARVQNESLGEDIVISEEMLQAEGVLALLLDCQVEKFSKNLKGLSETATLFRIQLQNPAVTAR